MCYGTVTALIFAPILLQFSLTLILGRGRERIYEMSLFSLENSPKKSKNLPYQENTGCFFFFFAVKLEITLRESDHKGTLPLEGATVQKMILK